MSRKNRRSQPRRKNLMVFSITREEEDEIYPGHLVIAADWIPKYQKIKKAGAQRTTGLEYRLCLLYHTFSKSEIMKKISLPQMMKFLFFPMKVY